MNNIFTSLLIGVVALAAAKECSADSAASASITDITISFTSLAPPSQPSFDPNFNFTGWSLSSGWVDPLNAHPSRPSPDPAVYYYQPGRLTTSDQFPHSSGSVMLNGLESSSATTANSMSLDVTSSGAGNSVAQAQMRSTNNSDGSSGFILGAYSSFTVTGRVTLRATSDGVAAGDTYWLNSFAEASAYFQIEPTNGTPSIYSSAFVSTAWGRPDTQMQTAILTVTYSNPTDQAVGGNLFLYSTANAASVVPELSTQILFLAGLLVKLTADLNKAFYRKRHRI